MTATSSRVYSPQQLPSLDPKVDQPQFREKEKNRMALVSLSAFRFQSGHGRVRAKSRSRLHDLS